MHDQVDVDVDVEGEVVTPYDRTSSRMVQLAILVAAIAVALLAVAVVQLHALPHDGTPDHLVLSPWWWPAATMAAVALVLSAWAWWRHSSVHAHAVIGPRLRWPVGLLVLFAAVALGWTGWTSNDNYAEPHTSCGGSSGWSACPAPFTAAPGRPADR